MSNHQIECITAGSPRMAEWDQFVSRCPAGTLYHSSAWLAALTEGMGQDIRIHFLTGSDGIQAGVVVRESRKFGFSAAHKPWATAYNGLVAANEADPSAINALLDHLEKRYHRIRLVHSPHVSLPPLGKNWIQASNFTAVLDISETQKTWDRFDRHARQRIRKAMESGVTIAPSTSFDDFHALYRRTYERQQLQMPLSQDEITATLSRASASVAVTCFAAHTKEGDTAAMLVVGQDVKRAYFMLAASHPVLRKTDAVSLLWWNVILMCSKSLSEIDLVGMDVQSVARFKNSFSPRPVSYPETNFCSSWYARAIMSLGSGILRRRGRLGSR